MRYALTFAVLFIASTAWSSPGQDAITSASALNDAGEYGVAGYVLRTVGIDDLTTQQAWAFEVQYRRAIRGAYLYVRYFDRNGTTTARVAEARMVVVGLDPSGLQSSIHSENVAEIQATHGRLQSATNAVFSKCRKSNQRNAAHRRLKETRSRMAGVLSLARYEDDPLTVAEDALSSFAAEAQSIILQDQPAAQTALRSTHAGMLEDLEKRFLYRLRREAALFEDAATTLPTTARQVRALRHAYVKLQSNSKTKDGWLAKAALENLRNVTTSTLELAQSRKYLLDLVAFMPTASEKRRIFDALSVKFQGGRRGYMEAHVLRHEGNVDGCIAVARALDDSSPPPIVEPRATGHNYEIWALYEAVQASLIAGRTDDAEELLVRMEDRSPRNYYTGVVRMQIR